MLLAFPGEDVLVEISYTEGAQAEVLGPSALVVVPATSTQAHPGDEVPEASPQVLPVDSAVALQSQARRITRPQEYDGHLFLDRTPLASRKPSQFGLPMRAGRAQVGT